MLQIFAIDKPAVLPLTMPDRFRLEVVYYMTPGDAPGAPKLSSDEYWIRTDDAKRWLDDGVVTLVSPLDAESVAEIEISEDHERWLEWLVSNEVQHVRLQRS